MSKNVRAFELKLGKRALILFVLGMSCLLFIVFLFGVTVGKNIDTYPEKYARGVPGMIIEKLGWSSNRTTETTETATEASKEPTKAAEEEKGSEEKKEPVAIPPKIEEKPPAPQAMIPAREQKPMAPQSVISTREQKTPSPPAVEKAKKQALPEAEKAKKQTTPEMEKYQIQVVSYKEREKADQLRKKLAAHGFKPVVVVTDLHEKGKWFRVTLEGYDSKEQAQKAADSVTGKIKGVNCVIHKVGERNN